MHPILSQFRRVLIYLLAWIPIAGLVAYLLTVSHEIGAHEAIVMSVPLCLLYAFLCLTSWYSCRGNPLEKYGLGPDCHASNRGALRSYHLGRRGGEPRQHAFEDAIFSWAEPPFPARSPGGNRHRSAGLFALGHLVLRDNCGRSLARCGSARNESQRPRSRRRAPRA